MNCILSFFLRSIISTTRLITTAFIALHSDRFIDNVWRLLSINVVSSFLFLFSFLLRTNQENKIECEIFFIFLWEKVHIRIAHSKVNGGEITVKQTNAYEFYFRNKNLPKQTYSTLRSSLHRKETVVVMFIFISHWNTSFQS